MYCKHCGLTKDECECEDDDNFDRFITSAIIGKVTNSAILGGLLGGDLLGGIVGDSLDGSLDD